MCLQYTLIRFILSILSITFHNPLLEQFQHVLILLNFHVYISLFAYIICTK
jgi:hypothetical protein